MAPRKGMFMSNKVKPTGSFKENFKATKAPNEKPSQQGSSSFFFKPDPSQNKTINEGFKPKTSSTERKPFDKKKWRMQRYSRKYKVQQWEDRRKKEVLREYYKQIDDRPKFDVKKIYDENELDTNNETLLQTEQEEAPIEENEFKKNKKKAEKKEALKKSKEERLVKFKRLNRKTKKGQPIMKDRMEFLLEQIQKNMQK
nr:rRNA-processing protein FYV7 [Onthophagus taurus]